MFSKLRGRVDEIEEDAVTLEVGGVGYHVYCSSRTLGMLNAGEAVELRIDTHVREDHIHLYGFLTFEEREAFRLLTTVQGVGVKMGLALVGAFSPQQLTQAIAAKDTAALTRVSGVGPKLAERLVTELKSKVAKLGGGVFPAANTAAPAPAKKGKAPAAPMTNPSDDAVSALVNLGYNRMEAFTAVAVASKKVESDKLDDLIKAGLKELAR